MSNGMDYPGQSTNMSWAPPDADSRQYVFFFKKSVHNPAKSLEQSVPVFEPVDFVHIQTPGERDFIERPARNDDVQRWPAAWQKFKAGGDETPEGTPLAILFPQNPEIISTLNYLKIFTVQQMANLTAEAMGRIGMGAQEWVTKAKAFLSSTKDSEAFNKIKALQEKTETENAVLRAEVKELSDRVKALTDKMSAPEAASHETSASPTARRQKNIGEI